MDASFAACGGKARIQMDESPQVARNPEGLPFILPSALSRRLAEILLLASLILAPKTNH